MKASRRSFFGLMGTVPLAAKATVDTEIAKHTGMWSLDGLGNASVGIAGSLAPPISDGDQAYGRALMGASEYIKTFGIPAVMEFKLRDEARYVGQLDPDIASKKTWSMSVKIMTQRQRNYERAIERIEKSGWSQRGRATLKKVLGFDWPW